MNKRLIDEHAFRAGQRLLGLVAGILREEEYGDFLKEAAAICRDTLASYDAEARRLDARLRPTRN